MADRHSPGWAACKAGDEIVDEHIDLTIGQLITIDGRQFRITSKTPDVPHSYGIEPAPTPPIGVFDC